MNKSTHHQHERKKGNNTEANKFKTGGVKKEGKKKEREKKERRTVETGRWLVLPDTKTRNPKEDSKASNNPPTRPVKTMSTVTRHQIHIPSEH